MIPRGARFKRLTPTYSIKPFDCGKEKDDIDLQKFLFDKSIKYLEQFLAVTYILENRNQTIAYFSVSNDKISLSEASSERFWKKHVSKPLHFEKRSYSSFPAVKIGKLAVDCNFQGQRIGESLMDWVKRSFTVNNKTGCLFIIVDAINRVNTVKFYKKCGFDFLDNKDEDKPTRLMYYCLLEKKAKTNIK